MPLSDSFNRAWNGLPALLMNWVSTSVLPDARSFDAWGRSTGCWRMAWPNLKVQRRVSRWLFSQRYCSGVSNTRPLHFGQAPTDSIPVKSTFTWGSDAAAFFFRASRGANSNPTFPSFTARKASNFLPVRLETKPFRRSVLPADSSLPTCTRSIAC